MALAAVAPSAAHGAPSEAADPDVSSVLDAPAAAGEPQVDAAGAILWDPSDQRMLWGLHPDEARPMASLTKMLTALVLVEDADDLDVTVTVSATAADVGQASVGLREGQRVPLRSLVAGLMVESGNDAAVAVAEHVAGGEAAFVELMTERAVELGARTASFVNASGLTNDPAHHASPRDLAKIATAAMREPVIAEFAAVASATVEGLPPLTNRNELLGAYPGADGIKTGFTAAAGPSLAGSATRDGWPLIAVVLDSPERARDAAAVLDWGFDRFDRVQLGAEDPVAVWNQGNASIPLAVAGEGLGVSVPADADVWVRRTLAPAVTGSVGRDAVLGGAELVVDGVVVSAAPLAARDDIDAPSTVPTGDRGAATHVGAGLADALRGLARAAPVEAAASRRRGEADPNGD